MLSPGDVVLAQVQFTDTIVASITSNPAMKGVTLSKKDGALKESVIKTNCIFTISEAAIKKKLFALNKNKRTELYNELVKNLSELKS